MSIDLAISLVIVLVLTILISKYLRISPRYERKPREKSPWQSLDHGDDPTVDR